MIILDTNVISELFRREPSAAVERQLGRFASSEWFTTSVTEAEIRLGLSILPEGKKKHALEARVSEILREVFAGRILPFDSAAAQVYAEIAAGRRAGGRPISLADAQIASIARVYGASLVTRNVRDFDGCGLKVIDPWSES